jgi:hypothetical protein
MAQAFARSRTLFALIAAAMGDDLALSRLPEYVSRGKGRGAHSGKKWGPTSSNANMRSVNGRWVQKENGKRECERRVSQMDRNLLNSIKFGTAVSV